MIISKTIELDETLAKKKDTFGDRVLLILEQQRRTKAWLASEIGISKQAINYLLNHSTTPKYVNEIATALEISPEWLLLGKGSRQILSESTAGITRIPIISMQNIPLFLQSKNTDLAKEYTHITAHSCLYSCFATILENSSMEPLFNQGTLLIFNSENKPKNGDYIIFLNDDNDILFRQYFIEGKEVYLKAIDAMFKAYEATNITILGVLIESRNIFK